MRAAALVLVAILLGAAVAPDDLRGLRVGMSAAEAPSKGFGGFRCAAAPEPDLSGWQDWQRCPPDAQGRRALHFGYAFGDTLIGGHPVDLTALFGASGRLDELRIVTDPAARLFLRKKAFLLGLQARARYGEDGWSCTAGTRGADGEPVGGVFVAESCRKTVAGRAVLVERTLLRLPGTELKAFVGESRITVTAVP